MSKTKILQEIHKESLTLRSLIVMSGVIDLCNAHSSDEVSDIELCDHLHPNLDKRNRRAYKTQLNKSLGILEDKGYVSLRKGWATVVVDKLILGDNQNVRMRATAIKMTPKGLSTINQILLS